MSVRKAVIPAAGLGTRFLPATKSVPKEMLPVVDKPGIQYVVEEAVRAGIDDILIITGRSKKAVEDHFDRAPEIEASLEAANKTELLAAVRDVCSLANVHFVRQQQARGLGHAVGMARHHVGNEPFVVLLPDDLMAESNTILADMIAVHDSTGSSVVALKSFPEDIHLYGAVAGDRQPDNDRLLQLTAMVEKPPKSEAPSDLAIMGRYLFTPEIFDCIARLTPGAGGELQLTDAMVMLMAIQPFYGLEFTEGRYDTGNKIDWLRATVELALQHGELGKSFRYVLSEICEREGIGR
jgi:UTP--glucose-1-phosphate uridylyltransferase